MIWSTFTNACCALLKLEYEIEKLKLIVIEFRLRSYLHAHCTKIRPKAVKESIYQAPPYVAQTHKCTKVRTYGKQLIHNYIYVYTSGWACGTACMGWWTDSSCAAAVNYSNLHLVPFKQAFS